MPLFAVLYHLITVSSSCSSKSLSCTQFSCFPFHFDFITCSSCRFFSNLLWSDSMFIIVLLPSVSTCDRHSSKSSYCSFAFKVVPALSLYSFCWSVLLWKSQDRELQGVKRCGHWIRVCSELYCITLWGRDLRDTFECLFRVQRVCSAYREALPKCIEGLQANLLRFFGLFWNKTSWPNNLPVYIIKYRQLCIHCTSLWYNTI